ncbi:MAG TPA: GH25 family lysozyme [Segetibacter sp.]|nr:GH25 family lysozyme [Segetibacter sp.]
MAKRRSKKKNTAKNWLIFIPFILIGVGSLIYIWYKISKVNHAKFVRYPAFGIDIPDSYAIHGIDVSKYQSYIDWPSVKEMKVQDVRIGFAFIKATEGLGNTDRLFKRNWKKTREAGITRGAYHFFLATKSGKLQAKNFINSVSLEPGDLPPVLDIEQLYGVRPEKMRKEVQDWLNTVEDYYKVKPIIYTYVNFYTNFLAGQFDDYPLWAAHYLEKDKPRINRRWVFWQHNERGRVNGITMPVDFNVFNGDSADFEDLLLK